MTSFFVGKQGGSINILKLMKLLYLSDRLSLEKYEEPITWDQMVSMDNGPVLSETLNYINGFKSPDLQSKWQEWVQDRANNQVSLSKSFTRDDLDYLSDADIEILNEVWDSFGHMNQWQLCDYTHEHCPEWKDPKGSSVKFDYEDVLRELGKTSKEVRDYYHDRQNQLELDRVFSQ